MIQKPRDLSAHPVRGRVFSRSRPSGVDLGTRVGSLELPSPMMNASGTAGHADELADYMDLSTLGAFVVKSLKDEPWAGNPAPRVHMAGAGMINSVGLQGPGVAGWLTSDLPRLLESGVQRIVVSIWGTTIDGFEAAAALLADAPEQVVAIECNLSCPNTESGRALFAHDPQVAARVIERCAAVTDLPLWAKLSANTDRLVEVAGAVTAAGAQAVTLINTLFGMVLDLQTRRPVLAGSGGGVSGPAIHPMAVRAVYDVRAALGDVAIVGVGGVDSGEAAVEMLLAGASAVQVGTAVFADPRAITRVARELEQWCAAQGVMRVRDLIGTSHETSSP